MSITVAPSTSFEASIDVGTTGLVGTLAIGIYEGSTDTAHTALASTTINEIGSSGVYVATRTSPSTAGQYLLVWSLDGTLTPAQLATEDLVVSADISSVSVSSGNLYTNLTDLKATLSISASTWDDDLTLAINAASRAIDRECARRFYLDADATSVRYYDPSTSSMVIIDDLSTLTSVVVDPGGTGTFGTTWTSGTHFDLAPYNAASDGWPYTSLELRSGASMPSYARSIKVTGQYGWPAVPSTISQATGILAARLFKRAREAPFSVYGVGMDGSPVRISRTDPDVCMLIEPYSIRKVFA